MTRRSRPPREAVRPLNSRNRRPYSLRLAGGSAPLTRLIRGVLDRLILLLFLLTPTLAAASAPPALEGVSITQKLHAKLPLDLPFTDDDGRPVRLGDLFAGRPVVLVPVYYKCPMLCTMTLNDLTRSMNGLTESVGREFDVITFSFDPRERPDLAAAKKRQYVRHYGRPGADAGWHFLTGDEPGIRALTDAIGFAYRYDPAADVYAHAAGVVVVTPRGEVSRYFLGDVPAVDLKDAIRDAAADRVAARPQPEVFLYCFRYDPATGRYGLIVARALQAMAALTVLGVAGLVGWQLRRHRSGAAVAAPAAVAPVTPPRTPEAPR